MWSSAVVLTESEIDWDSHNQLQIEHHVYKYPIVNLFKNKTTQNYVLNTSNCDYGNYNIIRIFSHALEIQFNTLSIHYIQTEQNYGQNAYWTGFFCVYKWVHI